MGPGPDLTSGFARDVKGGVSAPVVNCIASLVPSIFSPLIVCQMVIDILLELPRSL